LKPSFLFFSFFQLLLALNHAVSSTERWQALQMALHAFSHTNTELHEHEMSLGADKALCLKLGYIVSTSSNPEQVVMVCQCLEKVYQCRTESRLKSFRDIGATDIVPLLVYVWKQQMSIMTNEGDPENQIEREYILLHVLQILRMYAKLDETAKSYLIRWEQGAMVANFMQVIATYFEPIKSMGLSCEEEPPDLIFELLGVVKDLTFRSHPTDKEFLLRAHGGIAKRVLTLCCALSMKRKLAELITAIVWNLVLTPTISIDLLRDAYNGQECLVIPEALCKILSSPPAAAIVDNKNNNNNNNNNTLEGDETQHPTTKTKRNAISALGNLVVAPQNQNVLFSKDAQKQLQLIPILIKLVENDPDSIVRRRAMRTLRCLSSSSSPHERNQSGCIDVLMQHDIISFLVDTISRNVREDDDDNDRDTQAQACQTAGSLVDQFQNEDWPSVETALLERIESTTDSKLTLAACQCLSICVTNSPWRRGPACFSGMFWKRLETVVAASNETHSCIAQLLLELARQEKRTRTPTAASRPSTLACSTVVNTLSSLLSESGTKFDESRNNALDVVLLLVEDVANKRPLAENEGLLTALVNFCLLQQGPRKDSAKQVILDLVPEL
jgi:hypothetical protein